MLAKAARERNAADFDGDEKGGGRGGGLDAAAMWDRVRRRLRAELGEDVFNSWFARVDLEGLSSGIVRLSAPSVFLKGWIKSHYGERLLTLWRAESEDVRRVDIARRTVAKYREGLNIPSSVQRKREKRAMSLAGR